jgi:uncharacterized Zn-binding protein involved in type VI secretion
MSPLAYFLTGNGLIYIGVPEVMTVLFRSILFSALAIAVMVPPTFSHGDTHSGGPANPSPTSGNPGMKQSGAAHQPGAAGHGSISIPPGQPVPTLKVMVYPDEKRGWNLELKTTQFTFAPQRVNQTNIAQEGHAHLMINGQSVTRLYSNWYYIKSLQPGRNTIEVGLASNHHNSLMFNGRPIADTVVINVPKP